MNMFVVQDVFKKYFGYDMFCFMQADIIEQVYVGKDSLVLMFMGGGKFICYQVFVVIFLGIVVVVFFFIFLMKDQVEVLRANGVQAVFFNSLFGEVD